MRNPKYLLFFIFILILSFTIFAQGIKEYEFAGPFSFYPEDRAKLNRMIDNFILKAKIAPLKGEILGVVAPHAGYIYSGQVAAYSYKSIINKDIETIILLGPSHRYLYQGISVYPQGYFNTPLGKLEIDNELALKIAALNFVNLEPKHFFNEHSLEVQLPFIIKFFKGVKIVPLLFSRLDFNQLKLLSKHLLSLSRKNNILIVVSTDLSHYHPYKEAKSIDLETVDYIEKNDSLRLWQTLAEQRACGILPLITFMLYVEEAGGEIKILKYANSGDTAGDKSKVVGYVAAVGILEEKEQIK